MANISKITLPDGASYDLRDNSKATITTTQVTIDYLDWREYSAAETVNGVTTTNTVLVTYAPESKDAYIASGIYCSAQSQNSLLFTCSVAPAVSIIVNVMIIS